jgi:PAS domain S-box-containing protein
MAGTGTNNRKSKMERLRPVKVTPGNWLSGNMAQMMVFLNGLIVSITAFAILNVFINEIVEESFATETVVVKDYIDERMNGLSRDVEMAATLVSFSHGISGQEISRKFENDIKAAPFRQLYWLSQQESGHYSATRMVKEEEADNTSSTISSMDLHKYVIRAMSQQTLGTVSVLTDYKQNGKTELIFASKIQVSGRSGQDVVYGVTAFESAIPQSFFSRHGNVMGAELFRKGQDNALYTISLEKDSPRKPVTRSEEVALAGQPFVLSLTLVPDPRESFLLKVPFLMLLFGVTLTLIGTLYVRTNQKQSLRLSTMNAELEKKNIDLNREVIEREKLNTTLRRAEKENRSIIDSVNDIIFETTTNGEILFLNRTWEKITGFAVDRSLGRSLFDLLYMQDQAQQRANFAALVSGQKQGYRAFTRLRTVDGTFRAVELSVSMIRQDENQSLRVVGAITDVEERRRAERALSEAEKKYRAIVENAASGIYQVTPEGQYLSANPAMAKILGYDAPEEILRDVRNANIEVYCSSRDRERLLMEVLKEGEVAHAEMQLRRRDDQIIWVQENIRAVRDDDGTLLFYEGLIENITQRKETEIALRKAMVESDLASRSKSEFLANMSHELRTPLNAIIGFSDIIRNQAFGAVGAPEYLEYARDINDGGKRLLQIINDILDVSRVAAGDRQLNESLVDLPKVVNSALEILAPKLESNKLVVSNLIQEDAPKLIGESHAIKQMIINLLSNSIKYTLAGGRISVSYQMDDDGQFHLAVTDTGMGLTDSEIETALTPFGQVETSLNKTESGTGLGLTLVQSLMGLHGGSFELFSQKGIGTTATLVFPAKRVSMPKKAQSIATEQPVEKGLYAPTSAPVTGNDEVIKEASPLSLDTDD